MQCDIDFVAQELVHVGVQVNLGRWSVRTGGSLWEQIERFMREEERSDAWLMYATRNSLGSRSSRDEFSFAIERVIDQRGDKFPVVAVFPGPVDNGLIPAGHRTDLCVSLSDPEWKEQIKVAAEKRSTPLARPRIEPFAIQIHQDNSSGHRGLAIEIRPRAGIWSPFFSAVPRSEKERIHPRIKHGPRGLVPRGVEPSDLLEAPSSNDSWWVMFAPNEATPTLSYFIHCNELPSRLAFGVHGGRPQFIVDDLPLYA